MTMSNKGRRKVRIPEMTITETTTPSVFSQFTTFAQKGCATGSKTGNRSKAIVKRLLEYGMDVNAKTHRGRTALH